MLVSVITTLYNYKKFVGEAIRSFLKQDFADSEMIIVDDCSTDNSCRTVKKYECDRVIYIPLSKNQGYSHAKNVGIRHARAEILVMLDADDMLTKNGISTRYNKMMKGDYDFVHGPALDFKHGKLTPSRMKKLWLKHRTAKYVHAQGVMLKKDIHRQIGLYDEELWCKSDREMFYRIHNHGFKIGWVKDYVSIYRIHPKQMHKSKKKLRVNDQLQIIVKKKIAKRKTDLSGLLFLE